MDLNYSARCSYQSGTASTVFFFFAAVKCVISSSGLAHKPQCQRPVTSISRVHQYRGDNRPYQLYPTTFMNQTWREICPCDVKLTHRIPEASRINYGTTSIVPTKGCNQLYQTTPIGQSTRSQWPSIFSRSQMRFREKKKRHRRRSVGFKK